MTTSPIPDSIHSLLSAAAIGVLDADEQRVVDQYVEEHPDAQAELTALRTAASRLDSPDGPRPEVWARIVDEIDHDRRTEVVFIGGHRRRTRPVGRIAAVAAAVAVLAGTAAALTLDRNDGVLVKAPPSAQLRQSAEQALGAAGAQRASVVAEDGTTAHVVVLPSGVGYVLDVVRDKASTPTPLHVLYAQTPTGFVEVARLDQAEPIAFQLPADTRALAITASPSATRRVAGAPGSTVTSVADVPSSGSPVTGPALPSSPSLPSSQVTLPPISLPITVPLTLPRQP